MAKKPPLRIRTLTIDPEVPPGQRQRALFYKLGLDPENPEHWEQVEAYLAKHVPVGGPPPEWPEDSAPVRRERRPQQWDALARRRLVQRFQLMKLHHPDENDLAICERLAKLPEYKEWVISEARGRRGLSAKTLQRQLAEACKDGIT
jgi:hypothetical protein